MIKQLINKLIYLCCIAAILMAAMPAQAQVKIKISDQIVRVKGEKMYVHNVTRGETIYSICKAYKVTAEQLQQHNPVIQKGLKEGQLLYIPTSGLQNKEAEAQNNTISQKETLANTIDSQIDTLTGQKDTPTPAVQQQQYVIHKVRWFEDLNDIAEKYGVSKQAIMALNNMTSEKVKKREKLKIPVGQVEQTISDTLTVTDPNAEQTDYTDTTDNSGFSYDDLYSLPDIDTYKTRNIALLLPLNSSGKVNSNYMDFYGGALIAIEKIKQQGGNLHLNVIDYASADLTEIAGSSNIEDADMIIGPIRKDAINEFLPVINNRRIPIISPLDSSADSLVAFCPYLFQAALSKERQNEALASIIEEQYRTTQNPNVILVHSSDAENSQQAEHLKQILEARGIYVDFIGNIGLLKNIKKNKDNIIIAQTTTESTTAEVLRNIEIQMVGPEKITLFGTSKWKGFESLDMNLYFKYKLQISMPYNVDLSRPEVQEFIRTFRATYNREPSANAFSGFDIVYLFCRTSILGLGECAANPRNLTASEYIERELLQHNMLQQNFRFMRVGEGGWVNTATTRVSFNPDYTISSQ